MAKSNQGKITALYERLSRDDELQGESNSILLSMSSINLSKLVFSFVPMQDFSKPWTDAELYAKYNLTDEEIAFIESMIKPMELGGDE